MPAAQAISTRPATTRQTQAAELDINPPLRSLSRRGADRLLAHRGRQELVAVRLELAQGTARPRARVGGVRRDERLHDVLVVAHALHVRLRDVAALQVE